MYYFINDISNIFNDNDNINLNLYADETSLSIYANSDYEISENMKLYVGKLVHWFTLNNIKLNIEKTKILPYFNTIIIYIIKIDNVDIELVNYYKFLAITLDNKLKYSLHIDFVCIKLSKIIYLFKKLSFLNLINLILLYNSFFLSNVSYGIEIWGNYKNRLH